MDIRRATLDDAPAILSLVLAAMPNEEQWRYCFPSSAVPASDVGRAFQVVLERCLADDDGNLHISLLEVPHGNANAAPRIVSVAMWENAVVGTEGRQTVARGPWHGWCCALFAVVDETDTRPVDLAQILLHVPPTTHQVDTSRLVGAVEAANQGRGRYLDGYGPQMYLHLLATHPDHRHRGYAKALCNWTMKAAIQDKLAVSLLASPRGYIFFSGLGFVDLGPISLPRSTSWEDGLNLKAMAFLPERTASRRSSLMSFFGLS